MHKSFPFAIAQLLIFISSCQENFDLHLQREAQEYTLRHCPMRIEEGNTLDSITYDITSRCLTRWHTLHGIMDTETVQKIFSDNFHLVRNQLLRELRGDTEKNSCKDQNVLFRYIYRSASTQQEIFTTTFTPKDYQR